MSVVRSTQFWRPRVVTVTPVGVFTTVYTVPGGRTGILKNIFFWNTHPTASGRVEVYLNDVGVGVRTLLRNVFVASSETSLDDDYTVILEGQAVQLRWTVFDPVPASLVTVGAGALLLGVPS